MAIQLHDAETFGLAFVFDCETAESEQSTTDWSEHPIESGAVVADFGVDKPDTWTVAGKVTATPFGEDYDPARLGNLKDKLKALQKKKQPIGVAAGYFTAYGVITSVSSARNAGDAEEIPLTVNLKEIWQPEPTTVTMPAARIKPKPRKRAAPPAKGGKAAAKPLGGATVKARRAWSKRIASALTGN